MKTTNTLAATLSLALLGALYGASSALATPILGTAQNFAVLGATTVTNTGATTITGDLGLYPGTSITGISTITLNGTTHQTDGVAQQAQIGATAAYNALAAQMASTHYAVPTDLSGMTLHPGVYNFGSSAQLTGLLTLDFGANPTSIFVFQVGTTLTALSGSVIDVLNGGANSGVYWEVGSSATLGTGSTFAGNILADQSITLATGANLCGRAIALNAAVTMDTNTISNNCSGNNGTPTDYGSSGFSGGTTVPMSAVPEPETNAMLLSGLGLIGFVVYRRKDSSSTMPMTV